MDSYKVIERKLKAQLPFKGNSMSAHWFGNSYVIYSYNTLIASIDINGYEFDDSFFSRTTSRHQGLVRRALGI